MEGGAPHLLLGLCLRLHGALQRTLQLGGFGARGGQLGGVALRPPGTSTPSNAPLRLRTTRTLSDRAERGGGLSLLTCALAAAALSSSAWRVSADTCACSCSASWRRRASPPCASLS